MISPTIGRVVLFHPAKGDKLKSDQAMPALISYVWNDRMVNLAVFDANGHNHSKTSVTLLQDDDVTNPDSQYCEWMPFQKGQAAKYDELAKSQSQTQAV